MATLMQSLFQLFSAFLCIVSLVLANGEQGDYLVGLPVINPTVGAVWPQPQVHTATSSVFAVDAAVFMFTPTSHTCDILDDAFRRYLLLTFPSLSARESLKTVRDNTLRYQPVFGGSEPVLKSLAVEIKSSCDGKIYPTSDSDESYDLNIGDTGATLTANTVWGGLRGLETFSQLVWEDDTLLYRVNFSSTHDFPRFLFRGTLLDTSRHFLTVSKIKEHLDAMAQNKMNVFHWHIVDSQSFPYESYTFENLSRKGAYSPTHVYTQEDVKEIIEYARIRGIRVIPEFDSPGHSLSWGPGQPGLLTPCYSQGKPTGQFGPIDPTKNSTYDFLGKLFSEVSTVFPDHFIHMGGDEVPFDCWKSNPQITKFMQLKKFGTDYAKLEQYYIQTLLNIVGSLKKGYVVWQEVVDNGVAVNPDTVVEIWKSGGFQAELSKVTKMGLRTILSACWYLNRITTGVDWPNYYKCDPHNFQGTAEQKKLVIGGEACMWGEWVDGTNLISRFWPRASAVAERLWSSQNVTDINMATRRMVEHRCRLLRRGLAAEPINGPSFCRYEV